MSNDRIPIACTLPRADSARQALEWQRLQQEALSHSPIDGGVADEYPAELRPLLEDLVRRESACCGFLDFALTSTPTLLRLDVTSTDPAAEPVIGLLAGPRP